MPSSQLHRIHSKSEFEWYRWYAHLSREQKYRVISTLTNEEAFKLKYTWAAWARDKQLAEVECAWGWDVWLLLSGRGFGKTKTGSELVNRWAHEDKHARIALVGRTTADVRDVMVEGESGILASSPPRFYPRYEPSKRRLTWPNGAIATTYSAEEPDMLRGPQHSKAWGDEIAAWKYRDSYDQLLLGLRLGKQPQLVATTTPRATKLIRELMHSKTTHVTRGTTYENKDNLARTFFEQVITRYENTRMGRQELLAELLEDAEGALWKREAMIEAHRVAKHPDLKRVVVGVDPPASSGEESAECGIVVAGIGVDNHGYVLADCSVQGSPHEWARAVITAYNLYHADRIVAEVNQGGEMVESVIMSEAKDMGCHVAYEAVRATRGKQLRAEPVSAIYEQGRAHHVGMFPYLEDQMCQWVPGEKSPDRLDALVWVLTKLMLEQQKASGLVAIDTKKSTMSKARTLFG